MSVVIEVRIWTDGFLTVYICTITRSVSVRVECEEKEPGVVNYEERAGGGQRSAQHPLSLSLSSFDPLISNFPSLNKLNSQTQLSTAQVARMDGCPPRVSPLSRGDPCLQKGSGV